MTFSTGNQGNPINGVSQQPAKNRFLGQCTASDNFKPDVVQGLITRQGTDTQGKLIGASVDPDVKWHYYDRGDGEQYHISIEDDGTVKAWSPDGTIHSIGSTAAAIAYLVCDNPREEIKPLTIGDYTFLVNTTKTVLANATDTPSQLSEGIINVKFMDYGQTINVYIDSVLAATYVGPQGLGPSESPLVAVDYVANQLYISLSAWNLANGNNYTLTLDSNTVYINRFSGLPFTLSVEDDAAGANTVAVKDKIKSTTDLPKRAPEGFLIEIDPPGATFAGNDNYWLKAENNDTDHITWRESISPDISLGLDVDTMPVVLVRDSVQPTQSLFTLRVGEWEDRTVGDDASNPQPVFVDNKIQNIGLMQNRIIFTSGEEVLASKSTGGGFFDFFRTTSQLTLSTDPLSFYADVPKVNFLESMASFDGSMVFFSKNGQFILRGDKALTSASVLETSTSFESKLTVEPVASGDGIFFTFNYGRFTGIREFFTDSITDTKKARPVTEHVNKYVAGSPTIMATSTNLNMLAIKTDNADNILYVYDWLWRGDTKVQSAWGRYIFAATDNILNIVFNDELMIIVIEREDGSVYSEKMNIGSPDDDGLDFSVRADRKIEDDMELFSERYRVLDPFPGLDIEEILCIRSTGAYEEDIGVAIDIYREGGYLYTDEDLTDTGDPVAVVIGQRYLCSYTPTNPIPHDEGGQALNLDKFKVKSFYLNYDSSGDVVARVEKNSGSIRTKNLTPRVLGNPNNLIGFAPISTGTYKMTIKQRPDKYTLTYETYSHIPLIIRDFDYNGDLNRRGRRIQ